MYRKSVLILWVLLLVVAALAGCKEEVPGTPLDKFVARMESVPAAGFNDSLLVIAQGGAPDNAFANYLLGNTLYGTASDSALTVGWGDDGVNALLDSAEVYFMTAVAQDSTFLEPMVNLGSLWDDRSEQMGSRQVRDGRLAEAQKYYEMALMVDPSDEKARCNLGSLFLRQRRVQEAKNEFLTALEYDDRSALAHYNLAIMFAEEKIYREAITEWELAAKYDAEGDIGERSRANVKIVSDLMNAPTPGAVK